MPKVSIVVPVYNKEMYLRKTLDTILSQSFEDWELIVIDDGSTDSSWKIIQEYKKLDSRISAITQKNGGVSAARNAGIQMTTGEWIWFVDADDVPSDTFLANIFTEEISSNIDVIVGNYTKVSTDGVVEQVILDESGCLNQAELASVFMEHQYKSGFWGYLWNKLIHRSFILGNSLEFQKGLTLAEDLKFMVSVYSRLSAIRIVPFVAMQYTVNALNSSAEKKIDYQAQLNIQKDIYDWIVIQNGRSEYLTFMKRQISYYVAFIVFYAFEWNENYLAGAKKLRDDAEISELLCPEKIDKVMKPIVFCVKNRKWFMLRIYLKSRKFIRMLYRIALHRG